MLMGICGSGHKSQFFASDSLQAKSGTFEDCSDVLRIAQDTVPDEFYCPCLDSNMN